VPGLYLINSSYILKGNLNVNETIEVAETGYQQIMEVDPATGSGAATGMPTEYQSRQVELPPL
jgi:hypothetical protein